MLFCSAVSWSAALIEKFRSCSICLFSNIYNFRLDLFKKTGKLNASLLCSSNFKALSETYLPDCIYGMTVFWNCQCVFRCTDFFYFKYICHSVKSTFTVPCFLMIQYHVSHTAVNCWYRYKFFQYILRSFQVPSVSRLQ